ncbi:MAG TPA: hypothetical protein VMV49_05580 [Candidatus Deferrimicrobium sp.]|nr:hypothetical protein [Candidatus Deferrimicrobium sp.]
MIFIYQIYAGNYYGVGGGLSYYSVTAAIFSIATAISAGASGSFVKLAKEAYTIDKEKGKHRAIQMVRINLIIGLFSNLAIFILAFLSISDPINFIMLLGAASAIFIAFLRDIFFNMMSVLNRFDMASVVGGLFGVIVFIYGFAIIFLGIPPEFLAFGPLVMILIMLGLAMFFYNRIKDDLGLGFKELLLPSKKYPLEKAYVKEYLKYTGLTTVSNLVVFGIFSHIVLLMAYICYNFWGSALGLSGSITPLNMTQLLTLIDAFVFIEVAMILFAGPLNVEIAEAYVKDDHVSMESSINAVGKIGLVIAIPISLAMMVLARPLLLVLAQGSVSTGDPPIVTEALLFQGWATMALTALGQAFYGLACIYGAALIGSGAAKRSAIGFGIAAIILFIATPAFIFLFGMLGGVLPLFGTNTYSLIGAGLSFLISGIFVLPYLARATRRHLHITYDLRIKRLLVCMTILGFFLIFAPVNPYAQFLQSFLPSLSVEILQILSLLTFILLGGLLCIILYCFFGVFGKGDGKIIQDTFNSFNLGWLARFLRKIGRFFYKLNPFNPK